MADQALHVRDTAVSSAALQLLHFARTAEALQETPDLHPSSSADVPRGAVAPSKCPETFQTEVRSLNLGGGPSKTAPSPHPTSSLGQGGSRRGNGSWKGVAKVAAAGPHPSLSAGQPVRERSTVSWLFPDGERTSLTKPRVSKQDENLHAIVRLGWGRLCDVHCNGLTGHFLGGHDKDLFVQCTGPKWQHAPLIDEKLGGCIMTCSQFEKNAGRELSKKWKESIHVSGEGEGSKATLIAWLKRKADRDFGERVVGHRVWVCSPQSGDYLQGTIREYMRDSGKHKVFYNERTTEELHLPVELLCWESEKPKPPPCGQLGPLSRGPSLGGHKRQSTAITGPSPVEGTAAPSLERTLSPPPASLLKAVGLNSLQNYALFHAGSGTSVTSDWKVAPATFNLTDDLEPVQPRLNDAGAAYEMEDVRMAGTTRDTPSPRQGRSSGGRTPGLRTSDGPTQMDVGDARTDSGSDGSAPVIGSEAKRMRQTCQMPSNVTPPLMLCSGLGMESALAEPCPLPQPPSEGDGATDPVAMARWLNGVAVCLDDTLLAMAGLLGPDGAAVSPAARFQAVLVHARRGSSLPGYYLAMLSRYEHFRGMPQMQRIKMAEFVMAALAQESAMLSSKPPAQLGTGSSKEPSSGPTTA